MDGVQEWYWYTPVTKIYPWVNKAVLWQVWEQEDLLQENKDEAMNRSSIVNKRQFIVITKLPNEDVKIRKSASFN